MKATVCGYQRALGRRSGESETRACLNAAKDEVYELGEGLYRHNQAQTIAQLRRVFSTSTKYSQVGSHQT